MEDTLKTLQLIALQGIPGSGKSTFAREFIKGKKDWVIVCKDDIRNMFGDYWVPEREKLVAITEENLIDEALYNNYNVIVDATNINPKTLKKLEILAKASKAEFTIKRFDIDLETAIERDKKRDRTVGSKVIINFYNNLNKLNNE